MKQYSNRITEQSNNKESGFTMLELMIAIFIILMALSGALALITKSVQLASLVKNQVVASNLAAEQIEVIRNIRDTNWLDDPVEPWHWGLSASDCSPTDFSGCPIITNVDYSSTEAEDLDDTLRWNGIYFHSSLPNTPFSRHIEILYSTDDDAITFMEVKSIVIWDHHGQTKQVELIDHLYDWKPE